MSIVLPVDNFIPRLGVLTNIMRRNIMDTMKLDRLLNGYKQIQIRGTVSNEDRKELTEEALEYFNENPKPNRERRFGLKQYAGFGEQRADCEPNMGPKHGSIVFEIDYTRDNDIEIDDDGKYLLLTAIANPEIDIYKIILGYLQHKKITEDYLSTLNSLQELDISE